MNNAVNGPLAVSLYKKGLKLKQIAERLGCREPAIYRAFRKLNYFTPGMKRIAEGPRSNYPPEAGPAKRSVENRNWRSDVKSEEADIAARRIEPRDPCFRCGARGDLNCGCSKARIGWRAG